MTNIQQVYENWREVWEIGNPKPSIKLDWMFKLQLIPALGSVLLSGTRTGNVVAELGSFSSFGEKLNYLGLTERAFIGLEAFLAFCTFEAAIFLAGTLLKTDEEDQQKNWAKMFLVITLVPVLLANIYPGLTPIFSLLGESTVAYLHTIVNSVVGVATTLIVLLTGKVIKSAFLTAKEIYQEELNEWEAKRKRAWTSSNELRSYKKAPKAAKKEVPVINPILSYMQNNGDFVTLTELPEKLNLTEAEVFNQAKALENAGYIVRSGMRLQLTKN